MNITLTSADSQTAAIAPQPASPYKGLMPYREEDSPYFFGRKEAQEIITNNLLASRLTVLYGASGVGKSSVLRAGVIAQLYQTVQTDLSQGKPAKLAAVVFNGWRDDPVKGLKQLLASTLQQFYQVAEPPPRSESPSLDEVLQAWAETLGTPEEEGLLLLILDQFEEYFLYHSQEDGTGSFAVEFPRAVNRPDLSVHFLISLREDALAKLDTFKGRIPGLLNNRLGLNPLDEDAACEAIRKPVQQYNRRHPGEDAIAVEPALVKAIIDQVRAGQIVTTDGRGDIGLAPATHWIETPYLQMVLLRLWQEEMAAGSRRLHLATLERLGGAEQIVKEHLNTQMAALSPAEQTLAAHLFNYLVTPSGTKIAYSVNDLATYVKEQITDSTLPCSAPDIQALLEKLSYGDTRILRPCGVSPQQPETGDRYEIFHDVMAPAILAWRRHYLEKAKHLAAIQKQGQQWQRYLGLSVAGTCILMGLLGLLGILQQRQELYVVEQVLKSNQALQQAQTASQILALKDALQVAQTVQKRALPSAQPVVTLTLQQILSTIQERNQFAATAKGFPSASQAALSPDGQLAASVALDGTVSLWTVTGQRLRDFQPGQGQIRSIRFTGNSQQMVTLAWDGTVATWDLQGQQIGTPLHLPLTAGWAVGVSPDGQYLVTTDRQGTMRVWSRSGQQITAFKAQVSGLMPVSFSPDGQLLATADPGGLVHLRTLQGQEIAQFKGHQGMVSWIKFAPQSQKLVTGGQDGTIRVWTWDGTKEEQFQQEKGPVYYLGISPDGQRVVTASGDGRVQVWDIRGNLQTVLRGHENIVADAVFRQADQQLVTVTQNGTVRVWDLQGRQAPPFQAFKGNNFRSQIRFSADGQSLITVKPSMGADEESGLFQWSLQGMRLAQPPGKVLSSFVGENRQIGWVSQTQEGLAIQDFSGLRPTTHIPIGKGMIWNTVVSPNQHWLVTTLFAQGNTLTQLWDLRQPEMPPRMLRLPDGARVINVAFSPDSQRLATASLTGAVAIWGIEPWQSQPLQQFSASRASFVSALEFSPEGYLLALGTWDNSLNLWNGQEKSLSFTDQHQASIRTVHFSADGQHLLTSSLDGTARLWDLQGNSLAEYPGHANSGVVDAAFSPDGKTVAVLSLDGYVQLWPVEDFDQLIQQGCTWIGGYLASQPEEKSPLTLCSP